MIREYGAGDLKSGFLGVRVAISINGKLKQKYYGFKTYPDAMNLAIEQEKEWRKEQLFYQQSYFKMLNNPIDPAHYFRQRGNLK